MRKGILASTGLLLLCAAAVQAQQWAPYYGYGSAGVAGNSAGAWPGYAGYAGGGYAGAGYAPGYYRPAPYPYYGYGMAPRMGYTPYGYSPAAYQAAGYPAAAPTSNASAEAGASAPAETGTPAPAVTSTTMPAAPPAAACAETLPYSACAAAAGERASAYGAETYGSSGAPRRARRCKTSDCEEDEPCDPPFVLFPGLKEKSPHPDCFWIGAEYMAVSTRAGPVIPLVTTGSPADALPGAIGQPSTQVLFGKEPLDFSMLSGIQGEAGYFLDCDNHYAVQVAGFYLFPAAIHYKVSSDSNGNPLIARPFFDTFLGQPSASIVATPSIFSLTEVEEDGFPVIPMVGTTTVDASQSLWGTELNFLMQSCCGDCFRWRVFAGARYIQMDEDIAINDTRTQPAGATFLTYLGFPLAPGDVETDYDYFRAVNRFVGGQTGIKLGWVFGRCSLDTWAKVALGANNQTVQINGQTSVVSATLGNQSTQGGVLAQPSNIGNYQQTVFSVVPEAGINVGLDVTKWMQLRIGYSFLFWTNVVRPGDQMDPNVSSAQIPSSQFYPGIPGISGSNHPEFSFHENYFYMHTFTAGLELHF
jgi:hypothetical protein